MSEVVIGKTWSLVIATACLLLGIYCVQYALLLGKFSVPGLYVIALLLFVSMFLANFKGTRFLGLDVLPPNKIVNLLFWGALLMLTALYATRVGDIGGDRSNAPHFLVGIGLLIFFGLSFFGSFFAGFGAYLFLRNPISWVRDKSQRGPVE